MKNILQTRRGLILVAAVLAVCVLSGCPGKKLTLTNGTNNGPAPMITGLAPSFGATGTTVNITGTNFGSTQGSSSVAIGSMPLGVTNWSATGITGTIPNGAATGNMVVTAGGQASNGVNFTVVPINAFKGAFGMQGQGFDSNGNPVGVLLTFLANGLGQFNNGEVFVNDNGTVTSKSGMTGTYSIDANNRMQMNFDQALNTIAQAIICYLKGDDSEGKCVEEDNNHFSMGGWMKMIDTTANWQTDFNGGHVLRLSSRPIGYGEVDLLQLAPGTSGNPGSAFGFGFSSTAGTPGTPNSPNLTSDWNFSAPDSFGIGSFSQTVPSAIDYKYIHVSSSLTWDMKISPGTFLAGEMFKQAKATYSSSDAANLQWVGGLTGLNFSLNTPYSAGLQVTSNSTGSNFLLSAYTATSTGSSIFGFNGSSALPFFPSTPPFLTGQMAITANTPAGGVPVSLSGFLVGGNVGGIFLDTTNSSANTAGTGIFFTQTGTFTDSLLGNKFVYLSPTLAPGDRGVQVGVGFVDTIAKNYVGFYDSVGSSGVANPNVSFTTPATFGITVPATGAGFINSTGSVTWTWNLYMNRMTPNNIVDFTTPAPSRGRLNLSLALSF